MNAQSTQPVIPCARDGIARKQVEEFAEALKKAAPSLGSHGMEEQAFWASGLFQSAVERLRGQQAASTRSKRDFLTAVLGFLKQSRKILDFAFTGSGERHDYQILMRGNHCAIFEAKGCLDGNNTTIFQRPPNANEFFIWSLCQNRGSDPRHNAWSGIHTRLGGAILAEKQRVDALIIWDMLCGTLARPCPKLLTAGRATQISPQLTVPPPCIYLFPRTTPDPRNNSRPSPWKLAELPFINTLARAFKCRLAEIVSVNIEVRMKGANVERQTALSRSGRRFYESQWTVLKRAAR
jgi:hypothetical protein